MEEAKSEMSILDEDAGFIDTPLPPRALILHCPLIAEAPLWFFKLLPVEIFTFPLICSPTLHTKGGCRGPEGET